jgi:type I restriction enzyme S subunit
MAKSNTSLKSGYKQTSIGLIPNDWVLKKLKDLGNTFSGLSGKDKDDFGTGFPYIPYKNIHQNYFIDLSHLDLVNIYSSENQNRVKYGDVFFTTSSETINEIGLTSVLLDEVEYLYLNSFCFGFRLNSFDELNLKFFGYLLRGEKMRQKISELAQGSTRYNLSKSGLLNLNIPIPPNNEQQKIASILSTWDEAITKQKKLVNETKNRNDGLTQKLLSGKKRLSGFNDNWKTTSVSKVVDRVKNSFKPELTKLYQQIGIRSHTKGLFYKEPVSGKDLGNKSVFWIEPDCFIVNIVFAWEHAIAKTTDKEIGMIASHRFPMFKPKAELLDLDYLLNYFKSTKGKSLLGLASPGGAGRNKTLGQSDFLKLPILLPSLEEQQAISTVIEQANTELKIHEQHLAFLQSQKKGLMQKLLTGEIRVNVNTK